MPDRLLLESGSPDGYLLEDGTGVVLLEDGYRLKSTGIATNLAFCVVVDYDGVIRDLAGYAVTAASGVAASVSLSTWKGSFRKHFVTTWGGPGVGDYLGVDWVAPQPSMSTQDAGGGAIFIASVGAGTPTGDGNNSYIWSDTTLATGLRISATDKGTLVDQLGPNAVTTTSLVRDNATKFSLGANYEYNVNSRMFYGLESGSGAFDGSAVIPTWSAAMNAQGIGGSYNQGSQPGKYLIVAGFNRELTEAEFQSLHGDGTNDWATTLIDNPVVVFLPTINMAPYLPA